MGWRDNEHSMFAKNERKISEIIRGELRSGIEAQQNVTFRSFGFWISSVQGCASNDSDEFWLGTKLERDIHGCLSLHIISIW